MPISFVNVTQSTAVANDTDSSSGSVPGARAAGDLLIVWAAGRHTTNPTPIWSVPGWTAFPRNQLVHLGTASQLFWRISDGTETGFTINQTPVAASANFANLRGWCFLFTGLTDRTTVFHEAEQLIGHTGTATFTPAGSTAPNDGYAFITRLRSSGLGATEQDTTWGFTRLVIDTLGMGFNPPSGGVWGREVDRGPVRWPDIPLSGTDRDYAFDKLIFAEPRPGGWVLGMAWGNSGSGWQ